MSNGFCSYKGQLQVQCTVWIMNKDHIELTVRNKAGNVKTVKYGKS